MGPYHYTVAYITELSILYELSFENKNYTKRYINIICCYCLCADALMDQFLNHREVGATGPRTCLRGALP